MTLRTPGGPQTSTASSGVCVCSCWVPTLFPDLFPDQPRISCLFSKVCLLSPVWLKLSLPLCRLCPSYPQQLLVPAWITDKELENVAAFRSWKRIPGVVYRWVSGWVRRVAVPWLCSGGNEATGRWSCGASVAPDRDQGVTASCLRVISLMQFCLSQQMESA